MHSYIIIKICGDVIELVTMNAPNDTSDSEESSKEEHQKTELETVIYENKFHNIGN